MTKINKAIELAEKKVQLLKNLKDSLRYEECEYHIVTHKEAKHVFYSLWKIETKEQLFYGDIDRLTSYMNIRNMSFDNIYGIPPQKDPKKNFYVYDLYRDVMIGDFLESREDAELVANHIGGAVFDRRTTGNENPKR